MESGGSGIATTQSHHQGRASKHEHGDTSHVQHHSAHAAGGREVGALLVHDASGNGTSGGVTLSLHILDSDSQVLQSRALSRLIMGSLDFKVGIVCLVEAVRHLGLDELVQAVIHAREGSDVLAIRVLDNLDLSDFLGVVARSANLLVESELRQIFIVDSSVEGLVDIQL